MKHLIYYGDAENYYPGTETHLHARVNYAGIPILEPFCQRKIVFSLKQAGRRKKIISDCRDVRYAEIVLSRRHAAGERPRLKANGVRRKEKSKVH